MGRRRGQCATVSERTTPPPVRTTHASLYAVHPACSFSVQNIFCCCYFVVCCGKKCSVLHLYYPEAEFLNSGPWKLKSKLSHMSAFHYKKRLILNNVERVSVHNWWKQLLMRSGICTKLCFKWEGGSSTILQNSLNCSWAEKTNISAAKSQFSANIPE
jgi:hypothetical protein